MPRRDSTACPEQKSASQCVCPRDALQLPDRLAPVLRLPLPRSPQPLLLCLAGVHSPAREFRLPPRAPIPHQTPASPPSTIRRYARAFPKVLPPDAASSGPASASAVPALLCGLPAARLFPAARDRKSRWLIPLPAQSPN